MKKFFKSKLQYESSSLDDEKLNIMSRALIREPLFLGVKAIDSFLTLGRGQRVGIFAGSGVGKSTLLGMIARRNLAEINVIALIGERSREVREFIDQELGQEGLRKSYVVVSTSDESPAQRIRAAVYAADTAKKLSLMGYHVLLMMDSLTRYCMALREVFLSMGEPPTSRGYTPSVLTRLPKLLEKAGNWSKNGSVTGIYTVLVDGDDLNDPIADHARATLDGHIVLSRKLAEMNQYPAIDVLQSISRCMSQVVDDRHRLIASGLRDLMAVYKQNEDLIQIGAYSKGSSKKVDDAIVAKSLLENYLKQKVDEKYSFQESQKAFEEICTKMSQDLRFSLSKFKAVLKYKKFLEDKEKVEFKKVNDLYFQEKELFDFLQKELKKNLFEENDGIKSIAVYQIKEAYILGLKKKIEKQTYILQRIERFLDKKKKDLQNAHIETNRSEKIIEKKSKDLEEVLKKKEWDEVDELFY